MRVAFSILMIAAMASHHARRAAAGELRVPSQYKTIQSAIDAAQPLDRILVAPGIYRERLAFRGIPLTVESEKGAHLTTIDAGGQGSVVTFDSNDGRLSVLRGFTLTGGHVNGKEARGAGVNCQWGSPTILENLIVGNRTTGEDVSLGAGLFASGAPTVVDNEFRENLAVAVGRDTLHAGGGVYAGGGWFYGNRITGNSLFSNRNVWEKVRLSAAAGAVITGRTVFISNRVTGNNACFYGEEVHGGGLLIEGDPVIALNLIRNNTARGITGKGGGIYCAAGSRPTIFSNAIIENFAESDWKLEAQGGGLYLEKGSAPILAYNTVRGNRACGAKATGAGLYSSDADPNIVGCIFWENAFWKKTREETVISFTGVTSNEVRYSLVGDGQFTGANGNFRADPKFADAFQLSGASPCIDRGEPSNPQIYVGLDINGSGRLLDGTGSGSARIDVGAHEFGVLRRSGRLPVVPGTSVTLTLEARGLNALGYLCAASLGNTGIPLPPPDPRVIPLSLDAMFILSIGRNQAPFHGFAGRLDSNGMASLRLDIPASPVLAGLRLYVAGLVTDSVAVRLVTNAVPFSVQP